MSMGMSSKWSAGKEALVAGNATRTTIQADQRFVKPGQINRQAVFFTYPTEKRNEQ